MADGRLIAVAALALIGCTVAGCTVAGTAQPSPDPGLVSAYFTGLDAAAAKGERSEQQFLTSTQVPAFADRVCDLNGVTITATPALSTLRPDPGWTVPGSSKRPSGSVYVVAVALTIRQGNSVVGTQIGSQRVVIDGGRAYGFAPCPAQ